MSEGGNHETGGRGGAIKSGFGAFLFVALCVFALQVYLNKPEDRPAVMCWAPYKVFWLLGSELPKIVLVRDPEIALAGARKAAAFNTGCICFLTKAKLFNEGSNGGRVPCK